jgi:Bacterial Ig-like domain (group 3)/FG-GAP-like repeat/Abnormal spindle-like microcephaly-assoc'd, ASPM-SPD-2-Hydin
MFSFICTGAGPRLRQIVSLGLLAGLPLSMFGASKEHRRVQPHDAAPFASQLFPAGLTFASQPVGTSSTPATVVLEAWSGSNPAVSVTGDFTQNYTCFDGAETSVYGCYVAVTFTPTAAGVRTGVLTVTDGGVNYTAPLTGTAAPLGATTTVVTASGSTPDYTLATAVTGSRGTHAPSGLVSFVNISNGNASLGTASLGASSVTLGLTNGPSVQLAGASNAFAADFNGDGKADLAIYENDGDGESSGLVSVALGKGDGTFTPPHTTFLGGDFIVGDFNGDGKPDIAVGGKGSDPYTVEYGNGDGSFSPQWTTLATPLTCLATADFNGDGKADLACIDASNTVTLLIGHADNTLTVVNGSPSPLPTAYVHNIVAADFNHDGKTDLAVVNDVTVPAPAFADYPVLVMLGNGDGTFQSPVSTDAGSQVSPSSVAAGDFNGDGNPDIVFQGRMTSSDGYLVLLAKGDGTFTVEPAVAITTPNSTGYASNWSAVAVADFDGDGKTDIAVTNDEAVQVLTGKGDGTFTQAALTDSGAETDPDNVFLVAADFNGDGVPDLAAINSDASTMNIDFVGRIETATATLPNVTIAGSGTNQAAATYAGDGNFLTSTSTPITLTASPLATKLTLASSASTSVAGIQIMLAATLSPYSSGPLTTNGENVTFSSNGASLGTAPLSSGVATLNSTSLPVGTDNITATYGGDTNFTTAKSNAVPVVVSAVVPAAAVSPGSLTFSSQAVGSTSAAQTVTLTNGSTATLAVTSIVASGDFAETNTCGTSVAGGSSCTIAITFTPTAAGARTGSLTITDNASPSTQTVSLTGGGASVALASSASALTIASPGGSATATIQISPVSGFSGTVNLTCAVTYPGQGTATEQPTCSLSPAQVQITQGSPTSSTLTVSTTAASAMRNGYFRSTGLVFAALLCVGGLPRRRWRGGMLMTVLGITLIGGMLGCSGGGKSNASTQNPGTTTGSYQVTVTATSGTTTASTVMPLSLQ